MLSNLEGGDFVLKRTKTPAEAVSLLTARFPIILGLVESPDELKIAEPYYAYERFAWHVQSRVDDNALLRSVGAFIDELARSDDPLLENVLVVSLLEKLAEDALVVAALRPHIGAKASDWLSRIERELFGRS